MRLPALFAARRRELFARLLVNGLAQGALAVGSAYLVMRVFDGLGSSPSDMLPLFFALSLAIASSAFLRRRERIDAELLGQHYVRSIRRRLYKRLLNSDTRELGKHKKGNILLKFVGDLSVLRRWISLGLSRMVVAGVALTVALIALTWVHWPFAIAALSVLLLMTVWILRESAALRLSISAARRSHASLSANITEKLNAVATIQAFDQTEREARLMQRQSTRLMRASGVKAVRIGNLRAAVDMAAGAILVLILIFAYLHPPPDMSPGMLAAVLGIIGFLTPPLRDLSRVHEYRLAAQVARAKLIEVSKQVRPIHGRRESRALQIAKGEIRFEGVSMGSALRHVNVVAPACSRIAVVGANGSGKTTLLSLIGRRFDPRRGRILIDGQNIAKVQLSSLRRQLAYVSGDVPLLRGSLRKNLCYGAGAPPQHVLDKVLADCELEELVARLPRGLASRITGDGLNLSQGEKVRVALARALLAQPRILLLDEADANLDAQAVAALDRMAREFPGTLLMATHRAAALDVCDRIWHLHAGRLEWTHRENAMIASDASIVPFTRDDLGRLAG